MRQMSFSPANLWDVAAPFGQIFSHEAGFIGIILQNFASCNTSRWSQYLLASCQNSGDYCKVVKSLPIRKTRAHWQLDTLARSNQDLGRGVVAGSVRLTLPAWHCPSPG